MMPLIHFGPSTFDWSMPRSANPFFSFRAVRKVILALVISRYTSQSPASANRSALSNSASKTAGPRVVFGSVVCLAWMTNSPS